MNILLQLFWGLSAFIPELLGSMTFCLLFAWLLTLAPRSVPSPAQALSKYWLNGGRRLLGERTLVKSEQYQERVIHCPPVAKPRQAALTPRHPAVSLSFIWMCVPSLLWTLKCRHWEAKDILNSLWPQRIIEPVAEGRKETQTTGVVQCYGRKAQSCGNATQ